MAKITGKNNDLLRDSKKSVSPKIYNILLGLVNEDKEDLAEMVLKIDYLIESANASVRAKDFSEATETIQRAEERMKMLKKETKDAIDLSYLDYLIDGVKKKIRK